MDFHQFLVPRLEGDDIKNNLAHYLELVKKGVAGFIVFGGEVEALREGITTLQEEAELPLIIASDLEQGLGQQVKGGTLLPPAAAISRAESASLGLARRAFQCMAREAAYVGINTIFAPVLDVDTNPENPIISTRAFSGEPETVSALGAMMSETLVENNIQPCGKHFPGHGSTSVDSHLVLPLVEKSIKELEACELKPFRRAIASGLGMMMLGHLSVPAIDSSGKPVSVSPAGVGFLRDEMGFSGITITDAMNMKGLGSYGPGEAARMALEAGVDLLLHPEEPGMLAAELEQSGLSIKSDRLKTFRKALPATPTSAPPTPLCEDLSREITQKAITVEGVLLPFKNPFVIVLSDGEEKGSAFVRTLREGFPSLGQSLITGDGGNLEEPAPAGTDIVVAIFSKVQAFKGGTAPWIKDSLRAIKGNLRVAVSFGSPHLIKGLGGEITRIYAWWASERAQEEVAKLLLI
jgi:beta-glucosidase-like glycosyl hydrolase